MKRQVVVIHGGDAFPTYEEYIAYLKSKEFDLERLGQKDWKGELQETLGEEYQVINLRMPNPTNAKYLEWRIWFEKVIPFLEDGLVLVGHSLGGIFLAKYLSENSFPKQIKATFLVAPPFDEEDGGETLVDFNLPERLERFQQQGGKIFLYHSKDDPVVPFSHLEKYKKQLPKATVRVFEDREHFNQEELPELCKDMLCCFVTSYNRT